MLTTPLIPRRADFAALARLALPVVVVQVGMMAMGVVDTLMVGRLSAAALAAVALGNLYIWGVSVSMVGILLSLDPVVSQAVGARDEEGVARAVQRGAILAILVTAVSSLLLLPVGPVLRFFAQPEEVVPVAQLYTRIIIPGILPFMLFTVLRQTLQAMHRVAPVVWAIVLSNIVNYFTNRALIFGEFGAPEMGVAGSAWATLISRWLMFVLLVVFSWRQLRRYCWPIRHGVTHRAPLRRMFRIGLPIGGHMFLEFGAFAAIALLMGSLGTIELAAHQIAINLASLTFMVPLALGQAGAVLVGHAIGAGDQDRARRATAASLTAGVACMCVSAAVFLAMPRALAAAYSPDPAVIALAAALIPIAGLFQVFDGLQTVSAGVLRGAGDSLAPMLINLAGFWLVGIPASVALTFYFHIGPVGLWWGFVAGLASVAALLLLRIRHRFGRELKRVVIDAHPPGKPQ